MTGPVDQVVGFEIAEDPGLLEQLVGPPQGRASKLETPLLHLVILGLPGPQGSKTAMPIYEGSGSNRRWTGRTRVFEVSHKRVQSWRQAVEAGVKQWIDDWNAVHSDDWLPLDCAIDAEMTFSIPRPAKSKFDDPRYAGAPAGPPDLSKYARATEDAITKARGWRDDARVVSYRKLAKVWVADPADPDSLPEPGAVIRLYRKELLA